MIEQEFFIQALKNEFTINTGDDFVFIELLKQHGYLEFESSCGSTITYNVLKPFTVTGNMTLDLEIGSQLKIGIDKYQVI